MRIEDDGMMEPMVQWIVTQPLWHQLGFMERALSQLGKHLSTAVCLCL